jgi:hypothetical protein
MTSVERLKNDLNLLSDAMQTYAKQIDAVVFNSSRRRFRSLGHEARVRGKLSLARRRWALTKTKVEEVFRELELGG